MIKYFFEFMAEEFIPDFIKIIVGVGYLYNHICSTGFDVIFSCLY